MKYNHSIKITLSILVTILGVAFFLPETTYAATGDITAVRITPHSGITDGWMAEIDIEGFVTGGSANYGLEEDADANTIDSDPANAKVILTGTSPGYNTSGVLGTISRTVYGTKTIRKPYPDNTSSDHSAMEEAESGGTLTIKVALSEFIYDEDTVTISISNGWYTDSGAGGTSGTSNAVTNLAVTNSSALSYPKTIGRWAWPGYDRVTDDFLVEAVIFHKFAQNGKPVAAVAFEASDQSGNTVYATTTAMTITTRTGDANVVLVYAATMDIDALTQGDVIDVNFKAYPWVGNADSTLDSRTTADGFAQPDERLGPLHFLNDKSGTYGIGYALVSTNGDDSTGTVYSSQVAAEAGNAFLTIGGAGAALKTYHNTNHSRNNAGGGIILLAEGDHAYPGTLPASDLGTAMDTWLIIKPASTAERPNTKISQGAGLSDTLKALRVKVEGMTLSPSVSSGSHSGFRGRPTTDSLWLHNNTINATSSNPLRGWMTLYATQNAVTALTNGFIANVGTVRGPFALVRGNDSTPLVTSHLYTVLGNKNVTSTFLEGFTSQAVTVLGMATSTNAIFAFNSIYNMTGYVIWSQEDSTGLAIVQNVFERVAGNDTGVMNLSTGTATTSNVVVWHNTFTGDRHQWGYNDEGTKSTAKLNWGEKFNIFTEKGQKTDTYGLEPNGVRVGNWPLVNGVGYIGNKSLTSSFECDFCGLFAQWGPTGSYLTSGFTNDKSKNTGSNDGDGDYTLTATSNSIDSATTTSSFYQLLPYDFLGNPIYGSPDSGAYEYQPPYTMGTHNVATSSVVRMYGDEKWRVKTATTTSGTADLSITIPGSDTSEWLDVEVSLWNTSGTYQKTWTEMSSTTGLTNTVHVVGDLQANNYYTVSVDGVAGSNITGDDCTSGVCLSNGSGEITFTYTGTYSEHEFDITDETAPTITNVSSDKANGTYTTDEVIDIDITFSETVTSTGNVTVTLDTGQTCTFTVTDSATGTCNYTVVADDSSSDLTVSTITGTIEDSAGNAMTNFVPTTNLAANKAIVIDTGTPVLSAGSPSGEQSAGTTSVTLSLTTNESALCKYGTTASTAYASIANTFSATSTSHSTTISGLTNATSYSYYIRCQDAGGNTNSSDYTISFSVAAAASSAASGNSAPGSVGIGKSNLPPPRLQIIYPDGTVVYLDEDAPSPETDTGAAPRDTSPSTGDSAIPVISPSFTKAMSFGDENDDVRRLQTLLAEDPDIYPRGLITGYFGSLTEAAVQRFQVKYGITDQGTPLTTGYGLVGPKTREKLEEVFGNLTVAPLTGASPVLTASSFTRDLKLGDSGDDVKALQQYLNCVGFTISSEGPGSSGNETNYFGSLTKAALVAFQNAFADEILAPLNLSEGTGYFGERTRKGMEGYRCSR
ncbi:MAG: peptidoglycan-binding protein [bacterium]|nr:peptidoglycan-binding protein [bacterium]